MVCRLSASTLLPMIGIACSLSCGDLREASWEVLTAYLHHKPVGLSTVQRIEAWARADVPLPRLVSGRHGPQAHMAALDQAAVCASVTRDLLALLSDSERRNHPANARVTTAG